MYDAITFTIVPYVDDFNELKQYIKNLAPKDLKKTKEINPEFCEFIKSGYTFSISVILNKNNKKFLPLKAENVIKEIEILQNIFKTWIVNTPSNEEYYKTVLNKLKKLRQEAERPSFNLKLFKRLGLIQLLVAYIMALITKECDYKIDNMGWFSDRDSLTTWMEGLINDLAFVCYDGICKTEK